MPHVQNFLQLASQIALAIDPIPIEQIIEGLLALRQRQGRLFCLGAGGSAANCSHAVNDFRKLCDIEAYSATDNVSELTARVNDDGWDTVFCEYLRVSHLNERDAIFVLSVGGGDMVRHISVGLIRAIELAKERRAAVYGVVGREDCFTKSAGDAVVVVPALEASLITPMAESFQSVVWHAIVSDPRLQVQQTTW
jgi:D-sedoheptulose 7-phosphate isomerase